MPYASGKHAFGFCDRTGFRYSLADLVDEYKHGTKTGLKVGRDVADGDHPQNFIGRIPTGDNFSLQHHRPGRTEPEAIRMLSNNPFKTGAQGSNVITVTEVNHGRSSSDTVRFRDVEPFDGVTKSDIENSSGYSITKVNDDSYTVTVTSTATVGSVKGGGTLASAGPVSPAS